MSQLRTPRTLAILACLMMGLSTYFYRPLQSSDLVLGDVLFGLGAISLWVALWRGKSASLPISEISERSTPLPFRWWHYLSVAIGLGCLLLLWQTQGPVPNTFESAFGMHHPQQFLLWTVGVLLIMWGMMSGVRWRRFLLTKSILPIVGITLVGLVIRLWQLEWAVHFFVDEAHFIEAMTRLWDKPDVQILSYLNPIANFTWVYSYWQSWVVGLFGNSLASARLLSVLFGTLTVPAVYVLGKRLFDYQTGLLAGALLMAFPPHIHFSRLALNNIVDPFFAVVGFIFLLDGFRTQSRRAYALAGVCFGLTQYFYEGGRILFPALVVLWLLSRLVTRQSLPTRRNLLIFGLTFVIIASPFYLTLRTWRATIVPRLSDRGVETVDWATLLSGEDGLVQIQTFFRERLNPPYLHLVHLPDTSAFYYGGETGLILPILVPLFFLGLAIAVWRWRREGSLLLMWVGLTILGNSLIADNTWTARYVVVFPALILLIAMGIRFVLPLLIPTVSRRWQVIGVGLLAVLCVGQVLYYFTIHMLIYNQQIRPFLDHQDVGFRTVGMADGTSTYLLTDELTLELHITTLHRLTDTDIDFRILQPFEFPYDLMAVLSSGTETVFFLEPEDTPTLHTLQATYPQRLDGPYWSLFNVPADKQYAMYVVRDDAPPP